MGYFSPKKGPRQQKNQRYEKGKTKKKENFSSFPHQVQPMARRRRKTNFVFLDYVEPGNNGEINGTVRQKLSSLLGRFHGEP